MPGLLVMTGVTDVSELVAASPQLRPTYVGRDLASLLEPHPAATVRDDGVAPEATCRAARVRAETDGDGIVLRVVDAGEDPIDLLRAAAVAAWRSLDTQGTRPVNASEVVDAVRTVEPGATWAR
jgi:hypothetical protein